MLIISGLFLIVAFCSMLIWAFSSKQSEQDSYRGATLCLLASIAVAVFTTADSGPDDTSAPPETEKTASDRHSDGHCPAKSEN